MTSLPRWQLKEQFAQTRVGLNEDTIKEYAEKYQQGISLPLPVVFKDAEGGYWVAAGFHRIEAQTRPLHAPSGLSSGLGRDHVEVELRDGSKEEALIFSGESNHAHGLPRSAGDKKHQVLRFAEVFPDKPQTWIAEKCHVTQGYVSRVLSKPKAAAGAKTITCNTTETYNVGIGSITSNNDESESDPGSPESIKDLLTIRYQVCPPLERAQFRRDVADFLKSTQEIDESSMSISVMSKLSKLQEVVDRVKLDTRIPEKSVSNDSHPF